MIYALHACLAGEQEGKSWVTPRTLLWVPDWWYMQLVYFRKGETVVTLGLVALQSLRDLQTEMSACHPVYGV